MRTVEIRATAWALGASLVLAASGPVAAQAPATGVPDAPAPIEKVIARHDGFVLPKGFQTSNKRRLPQGTYDLALIESAGRYFIQMINTETRKGVRVSAQATGSLEQALRAATDPQVSIERRQGKESLLFKCGEFTAALALLDVRSAG